MANSDHCAFVEKLSNLPGTTLKEKHASLYKLLQANSGLSKEDLDIIIPQLKPTTLLDRIHYVDFLLYFRRFNELFQEFKTGNEIALCKIAKHDWFFESAFLETGPSEFVKEILPTMGFNVRMKILKKLRPDEKQGDKMFEALEERYGIFVASVFLSKCSSNKIKNTLTKQPLKLTQSQLKVVFDKDPALIHLYIEERKKLEGNTTFLDNSPILVHIAQKNPEVFSELVTKYKIQTKLGRRTTRKFVIAKSTEILNKPKDYVKLLNKNALVRKLGDKSDDLFFKIFPRSSQEAFNGVKDVLKYYPKKKQFHLYKTTYDTIFHQKFGQNLNLITTDLLSVMSDLEEREKIASIKFEKTGKESWLAYYKPSSAFDILKQKVNYLSTQQRTDYLTAVLDNCFLTKDFQALLDVLEFVTTRLKNDVVQVVSCVLHVCSNNRKLLSNFSEHHWKYIMIILNCKTLDNNDYHTYVLKFHYVSFALKNNLPTKDLILEFKDVFLSYLYYDYIMANTMRKEEKHVVIVFLEKEEESDNESIDEEAFTHVLRICGRYNKEFPKEPIDVFKYSKTINRYIDRMYKLLDATHFHSSDTHVEFVICANDSRQATQDFQKLYFKYLNFMATERGILWFIKHKPEVISENFDKFFKHYQTVYSMNKVGLWRLFKQYTHLGLDAKMIESCTSALKAEDCKNKEQLLRPLSVLMEGTCYLEFTQQYIPTKSKVNLEDEKVKELYGIQTKAISCLKNIDIKPETYLSTVLQCCTGDYLKAALTPLYSCLYKIPEVKARFYTNSILKEPAVSFKKHGVILTCQISDAENIYNCLKNVPLLHLLSTFKYFAKNPSDRVWKIIKIMLLQVNTETINMLNSIMDIKIPVTYREDYTETVWQILELFGTESLKKDFVSKIDEGNINVNTLLKMLKFGLLNITEFDKLAVNLLVSKKADDDVINLISENLSNFKKVNWESETIARQPRKKLSKFINNFFTTYLSLENETETKSDVIIRFKTKFDEIFSPIDAFQEYVKLSLMVLKGETVDDICKVLLELYNDVIRNYNAYIFDIFCDIAKNFRNFLFKTESETLEFCHSLFKLRQTTVDDLFVVKMLPQGEIECTENIKLYKHMLTTLKAVDDDIVRLHLNIYLVRLSAA